MPQSFDAIGYLTAIASGTTRVYIFSGSKVIAEYVNGAAPASPTREYIYSGSQMLAKIEAGATNYYHADHLSMRVTTDSGGVKSADSGHYPYGESWYASGSVTKWKFTSYERDSESGNDYAMMRSYINRLGRFNAPDPVSGSAFDPQTWNRYSYVANNPVNQTDPSGLLPSLEQVTDDGIIFGGGIRWMTPDALFASICSGECGRAYAAYEIALAWTIAQAQAAKSGKAPLSEKDRKRYEENRQKLLAQLQNLSEKCIGLLGKLGFTADQVRIGVENQIPWDGSRSAISQGDAGVWQGGDRPSDPYFGGLWDTERSTSIATEFKNKPGLGAMAQLNGPDTYYRKGGWFGMGSTKPGNIFHETLHNLGKTDSQIQAAWGLPVNQYNTQNITDLLQQKGCVK